MLRTLVSLTGVAREERGGGSMFPTPKIRELDFHTNASLFPQRQDVTKFLSCNRSLVGGFIYKETGTFGPRLTEKNQAISAINVTDQFHF